MTSCREVLRLCRSSHICWNLTLNGSLWVSKWCKNYGNIAFLLGDIVMQYMYLFKNPPVVLWVTPMYNMFYYFCRNYTKCSVFHKFTLCKPTISYNCLCISRQLKIQMLNEMAHSFTCCLNLLVYTPQDFKELNTQLPLVVEIHPKLLKNNLTFIKLQVFYPCWTSHYKMCLNIYINL